jgi:hypothetical protein
MDYLDTPPNAAIRYHASDTILTFDTTTLYLLKVGGKSRAVAYCCLTKDDKRDFTNGVVDVLPIIIKHDMSSTSEIEIRAFYCGCKHCY